MLVRQPKKVTNLEKVVATKDVGIEVLMEDHRSMAIASRPKMMIALKASVNLVRPEIISDRGVKEKLILYRIRVIPRNLQLTLLLKMTAELKI